MVNKNTVKGAIREAAGKAKAAVGRTTGSPGLEAKGLAQEVAGKAQKTVGKVTTAIKSATK